MYVLSSVLIDRLYCITKFNNFLPAKSSVILCTHIPYVGQWEKLCVLVECPSLAHEI